MVAYNKKRSVKYTKPQAKAVIAKAIRKRSSVATNKRAISQLSRKLNSVKIFNRGPIQTQLQSWNSAGHSPVADSPFLHQVNDPVHNSNDVYHWNNTTSTPSQIGHFQRAPNNYYDDTTHMFNDKVFLKSMLYELKFTGFVADVRLRVDVIRQKKTNKIDYLNINQGMFMPYALEHFKNLAGFTTNFINYKYFEKVVPTKYLYMNTRGNSSASYNVSHALDGDNDEGTPFQVTTNQPPTKYCRINIPFNRYLRARDNTGSGGDADDANDDPEFESFRWHKQHPFEPVWMIISCDDDSAANNERVQVEIKRKIVWQDAHN